MASQSAISKLFGAVGGAGTLSGGGLGALVPGGLYHSGGVVGRGGRSRGVPSSVFAGAPRMHNGGVAGLRPDEVPAILQRGETVLPKGANTRAPEMRVIINNAPPHQREERQNETGGTDLLINFIKSEVAKDAANPKAVIGRSIQSMGGWPLMNKR